MNKANFKHPSTWLATWFGLGFIPKAPGTWGSLGAIPVGLALYLYTDIWIFLAGIVVITLIGFWATGCFEKHMGTHDSKMVVIDEVAGQWLALTPVFYLLGANLLFTILAFIMFRIFDIFKPWPASYFDKKVKGAWGVMGDDIIAGLYAAIIVAAFIKGLLYAGLG